MYFVISEELVDRDDLDIYEKMALVVLAKYANSSQKISKELLVQKMGADKTDFGYEYTDLAIKKLIKYGILTVFDNEDIEVLKLKEFSQEPEEAYEDVFEEAKAGLEDEFEKEKIGQKQGRTQKLIKVIEDKANESSQDFKYKIIDLSIRENVVELENRHGVPIEEIKSIFSEVCSNQKAKILYHLSEKNLDWIKIAYEKVKEEGAVDVLEVLAQYLQSNSFSDYSFQKKMRDEIALKNQKKLRAKLELERKHTLVNSEDQKMAVQEMLQEEMEEIDHKLEEESHFDQEAKEKASVYKNADLDFYNGYDLKSIFSNLEKKFEEGRTSDGAMQTGFEKEDVLSKPQSKQKNDNAYEDANKLNIRATSFKQAKTMYHSYGNSNVKKSGEIEKNNTGR